MKNQFILLFLFANILVTYSQNNIVGKYYSTDNEFEKWSIIELKNDGKFIYKYGLGGCQGEIIGKFQIVKNKINFINDPEFINKSEEPLSPIFPDLSLIKWKIWRNSLKPIGEIDTGCFKEKGKHKKEVTTTNSGLAQ